MYNESMIKVFVVEDEEIIRKSIIKNIPWEKEELSLVGDASDGELAFSQIEETKPDILITDVKMPFMNGLELSRLVKASLPKIKIIILSGYREFEYAKQAIEIGVTEFLSKPITSHQLLEVIKRVKAEIEKEAVKENLTEALDLQKRVARDQFLDKILIQELPISELITKATALNLNIISPFYTILLCKPMIISSEPDSFTQAAKSTDTIMNLFEDSDSIIPFNRGFDGVALLIKGKTKQELTCSIKVTSGQIEQIFKSFNAINYFGAIGSIENRVSQIYKSYQSANKAFSYRYFAQLNNITSDEELKETNALKIQNPNAFNWNLLENFFLVGKAEAIPSFVEQYLKRFGDEETTNNLKNYIINNVHICALAWLTNQNLPVEELKKYCYCAFDNTLSLKETVSSMIAIPIKEKQNLIPIAPQILKAQAYIKTHINDYGINLNCVADFINMSPNYFSTLFSQETGQTFIEYLTKLRINKACELLTTTNLKPIDISLEVGYQDSHYFSTLFKKETGCTPKEYRNKLTDNHTTE